MVLKFFNKARNLWSDTGDQFQWIWPSPPSPGSSPVSRSHFWEVMALSKKRWCSLHQTSENPAAEDPAITGTIQLVSWCFQRPWPKGVTKTNLISNTKAPMNSILPSEAARFPEEVHLVFTRVHSPLPKPLPPGTIVSSLLFFPFIKAGRPLTESTEVFSINKTYNQQRRLPCSASPHNTYLRPPLQVTRWPSG